jgi:hypothetical protein
MGFAPPLRRRLLLPVIETANLRVACLDSAGRFAGVRHFAPERWSALEDFAPNVLVGSAAQLQRLIERIALRTVNAASVDHSVFVLTQLGDTPLTSRFRDQLWRQFNVPIYEVYVDEDSQLLAFECEAQEGWHVQDGVRFATADGELLMERGFAMLRTGLNFTAEEGPCGCGREGTRLREPSPIAAAEPLTAVGA